MKMKMLYQLLVAAATGLIAAILFSLMIDWETVGGVALFVSPLLLSAVGLTFVIETITVSNAVKYVAFVFPLVLPLSVAAYYTMSDDPTISREGIDGLAQYLLKANLIAHLAGCACLVVLDRRNCTPAEMGEGIPALQSSSDDISPK